ncbi:Protein phosphatase PP2A regulatory subunit B [Tritrichomonas musculus]|uniref:Protein phosphatase PP2A regulatory subunit B n=1 Tax=Tritrichomonas musculus TaxID=1915356 RepID=A0ABR2KE74_9EUKA
MEKVSTIYINNLPPDTTQEQVAEMFNKYGKVKSVRLLMNDSNQCRGYAFLDYATDEEMNRAIIEANDAEFRGNAIKVEKSRHQLGDPPRSKRLGPLRINEYRYSNRDRDRDQHRRYRDDSPEMRRYRPEAYAIDPSAPASSGAPVPLSSSVRYRDESPLSRRYRDDFSPRYRDDPVISYQSKRDRDDSPPYRRIPTDRDLDRYDRYDRIDRERYRDDRDRIDRIDRYDRADRDRLDRDYPPRFYRNYSERNDDSPPPIRRILDDSPPPIPRRIIDDSPPPSPPHPTRRITQFDDSPPPLRRVRDDYAREDSPPIRRIRDDSPPQQPSTTSALPKYLDESPTRKRFRDD